MAEHPSLELLRERLEGLGCPAASLDWLGPPGRFVAHFTVPGADAVRWLPLLAKNARALERVAVLIGPPEEARIIAERLGRSGPRADLARWRSLRDEPLDATAWARARVSQALRGLIGHGSYGDPTQFMALDWLDGQLPGDLPDPTRPSGPDGLRLAFDRARRPLHDVVHLALVPGSPADAPFFLGFGGWNQNPEPMEHVRLMRAWWSAYQAQPLAVGHDQLECIVGKPPATVEEAAPLAAQLYGYCPDLVDQGTRTLHALAASLVGKRFWHFWWD